MSFIAVAVVGSVASAGAALGGAAISADAQGKAAQMQQDSANKSLDLQKSMFDQQQANQAPWRQAGITALGQMQDPSFNKTFSGVDMTNDPGYQFRLQQGQQALERSAAARGGLQSGGTLKGISDYAQNYASGEYQNAYNRFTNDQSNRFNRLSSLAGLGQTANTQLGQAGQNYASNAGAISMSNANAQAAAGMGQGQAWGNALSSIGNNVSSNGMTAAMMNRFMPAQPQQEKFMPYSQMPADYQGPVNMYE